jgi:predicted nucleotidyltransferase
LNQSIDRVPSRLRDLASSVIAAAQQDPRFVAVIVGGSIAGGTPDEYSDLDLVLVCSDEHHQEVLGQAKDFAARVGPLLVAFTGEHVGEPRLLIALYGPPVNHVDLKFVGLSQLDDRVEDGLVLWQRDDRVEQQLRQAPAAWPQPDPQWIEDRFWVWVHYVAVKIGRGELFEAVGALEMIRSATLAPLIVSGRTDKPTGVRRLEELAPELIPALRKTVAAPDRAECLQALHATVDLYRHLRDDAQLDVVRRTEAEKAVVAYVEDLG